MAKKGYRLVAEVEPLPVAGDPPPATRWSGGLRTAHLLLIALYEQVKRSVDAQWMVEQLLLLHPRVSLSRLHGAFPFKNHQHWELLLDGLRKAGVPGS